MAAVCEECKKEGPERRQSDPNNTKDVHDVIVSIEIAAADGHVKCLEALLNAGADVNHKNKKNGYTPLVWAVRNGKDECVDVLIKAGADVNICDSNGDSALMNASVYQRSVRCAELLIEAGADINAVNKHTKYTPLIWAVRNGHDKCVEKLIKSGADVNKVDNLGYSSLMLAVEKGDARWVELLLEAGADVNFQNAHGSVALFAAASHGDLEIVKLLIKAGADVNITGSDGASVMHCFTSPEGWTCIGALAAAGADVNAKHIGMTPLMWALENEYEECLKALVKAGADLNIVDDLNGQTALRMARGKYFDMLLEAGTDVNVKDKQHKTLLFSCLGPRKYELAERVIEAGADVNVRVLDEFSNDPTALFIAADKNSPKTICLLLRSDIRINVLNGRDHNALEWYLSHHRNLDEDNALKKYQSNPNPFANRKTMEKYLLSCKQQSIEKEVCMLLFAAGESVNKVTIFPLLYLIQKKFK